jgi:hypothetical protein
MTNMIDIGDPQELVLHTNASPEQLLERWDYLVSLLSAVGQNMAEASDRWKQADDPEARARLWSEYEVIARDWRVVCSWKDVFYAAFIFSTDGANCAAMDVNSS